MNTKVDKLKPVVITLTV